MCTRRILVDLHSNLYFVIIKILYSKHFLYLIMGSWNSATSHQLQLHGNELLEIKFQLLNSLSMTHTKEEWKESIIPVLTNLREMSIRVQGAEVVQIGNLPHNFWKDCKEYGSTISLFENSQVDDALLTRPRFKNWNLSLVFPPKIPIFFTNYAKKNTTKNSSGAH